MDYRLDTAKSKYDLGSDEGKVGFLREATGIVASLPSAVEREVYGARVAELCGVSDAAVKSEVARVRRRRSAAERRTLGARAAPTRISQPQLKSIAYKNPRSAAAEEGVIRLMCLDPALFRGLEGPGRRTSPRRSCGESSPPCAGGRESGESLSPAAMSGELSPTSSAC